MACLPPPIRKWEPSSRAGSRKRRRAAGIRCLILAHGEGSMLSLSMGSASCLADNVRVTASEKKVVQRFFPSQEAETGGWDVKRLLLSVGCGIFSPFFRAS